MKSPFFSIIVVVLNNKGYIGQAIENFLSQNFGDAELVIADGASTDGTQEIIAEYAGKFPEKIRFISEKDKGQSDAMNKALKMARGEYVSFLNVDDFYEPDTLNRVFQALNKHGNPAFIVGDCNVWDAEGILSYVNRPKLLKPWHILSGASLPVNPTAYFYKKSLHELVGFYTESNHWNMDVEFIALASLQVPLIYEAQVWGNFRMLPQTKTVSDQKAGKLEERKRELLRSIRSKAPLNVKLATYFWIIKLRVNKFWRKWNRIFLRPFYMVRDKCRLIFTKKIG